MKKILMLVLLVLTGCVTPQYKCLFDDGEDCAPSNMMVAQTTNNNILENWTCKEELSHQKWNQQRSWIQTDEGYNYQQLITCICINQINICDPISRADLNAACNQVGNYGTASGTMYKVSEPYISSELINECPSLIDINGPCSFWYKACNNLKM